MEKKVLEVEFDKVFDKWAWRITYQDEIILKRGKFEDKELNVYSYNGPYYSSYNNLFIRGGNLLRDNDILICDDEGRKIIEERVNAINEKYGKPKRWRGKFDEKYYYIYDTYDIFEVRNTTEIGEDFDDRKYKVGNYFKTEEEAQLYADKIKKLLSERE